MDIRKVNNNSSVYKRKEQIVSGYFLDVSHVDRNKTKGENHKQKNNSMNACLLTSHFYAGT